MAQPTRKNSPYADLEPLEFNIDGMHVMRWYGIAVEPHPACPVCGDFEGHMKQKNKNAIKTQ